MGRAVENKKEDDRGIILFLYLVLIFCFDILQSLFSSSLKFILQDQR